MLIQEISKVSKSKSITLFIILLLFSNCYSQKDTDIFFNEFPEISKFPIVFDEFSFHNESGEQILYDELTKYIIYDDDDIALKVSDTTNNKFYAYGKFFIEDRPVLILRHMISNEVRNKNIYYLLTYSKNHEFINLDTIADSYNGIASLIYPKAYYVFLNEFENNEAILKSFNPDNNLLFDIEFCNDSISCFSNINNDILVDRSINAYNFDKTFFETKKVLIPLNALSPYTKSEVLTSLNGQKKLSVKKYFIDSLKIKNDMTMIFFLNDFSFNTFEQVSEVGYLIINTKGAISKKESIASYHRKDNSIILDKATVIKGDENILIKKNDYKGEISEQKVMRE